MLNISLGLTNLEISLDAITQLRNSLSIVSLNQKITIIYSQHPHNHATHKNGIITTQEVREDRWSSYLLFQKKKTTKLEFKSITSTYTMCGISLVPRLKTNTVKGK